MCNAINAEYRVSLSVSSDAQLTVISPAVKGHKLCERLAEKVEEEEREVRRGTSSGLRTKAAHYFVKNATVKTENREKLQK